MKAAWPDVPIAYPPLSRTKERLLRLLLRL